MAKAPRKSTKSNKAKTGPRREQAPESKAVDPEIIDADEERPVSLANLSAEQLREELDDVVDVEIDPDHDVLADMPLVSQLVGNKPETSSVPRSASTSTGASSSFAHTPEIVDVDAPKATTGSKNELAISDPVAIYLAEIRKYPLLTKEKEQELARRYRETGDPKAAEMLVTSNLRFVVKVAAEYSRFGAKLIDLVQEGNVGLMHAVREFNPYKGVRLITYAVWWIRGYIQEYLMRQYSLVRIGTTQNQRKLFYRLQKEREALDSIGQEPTNALLAGRLGVTEAEVATMTQRLSGRDISLSQPIDGQSSSASLLDFESSDAPGVDETIGHLEEIAVLRENLEKIRTELNEKETYILENRILSDEPMTLQEIGEHYGVTREAIRQIEARLIGKIRAAVTSSLTANANENADESDSADE